MSHVYKYDFERFRFGCWPTRKPDVARLQITIKPYVARLQIRFRTFSRWLLANAKTVCRTFTNDLQTICRCVQNQNLHVPSTLKGTFLKSFQESVKTQSAKKIYVSARIYFFSALSFYRLLETFKKVPLSVLGACRFYFGRIHEALAKAQNTRRALAFRPH